MSGLLFLSASSRALLFERASSSGLSSSGSDTQPSSSTPPDSGGSRRCSRAAVMGLVPVDVWLVSLLPSVGLSASQVGDLAGLCIGACRHRVRCARCIRGSETRRSPRWSICDFRPLQYCLAAESQYCGNPPPAPNHRQASSRFAEKTKVLF
jgi:hypothetical protein